MTAVFLGSVNATGKGSDLELRLLFRSWVQEPEKFFDSTKNATPSDVARELAAMKEPIVCDKSTFETIAGRLAQKDSALTTAERACFAWNLSAVIPGPKITVSFGESQVDIALDDVLAPASVALARRLGSAADTAVRAQCSASLTNEVCELRREWDAALKTKAQAKIALAESAKVTWAATLASDKDGPRVESAAFQTFVDAWRDARAAGPGLIAALPPRLSQR